jgi:DNA-binding NtrC family response regulator
MQLTIVDDDPQIIFLVEHLLRREFPNSTVASFTEPDEALNHLHSGNVGLLITDHGMGSMTGTELIRELRREDMRLPIFMISHTPEVRDEAMAAGATEFLDKRQLNERLPDLIRRYLDVS